MTDHRNISHKDIVTGRQSRVVEVRDPSREISVVTIYNLKKKTVDNTLQEERHKLFVRIQEVDLSKVNAYLACSKCGKRGGVLAGASYTCESCKKTGCTSVPRISSLEVDIPPKINTTKPNVVSNLSTEIENIVLPDTEIPESINTPTKTDSNLARKQKPKTPKVEKNPSA